MSKYEAVYELVIRDKKYYVHRYILDRCIIFGGILDHAQQGNTLVLDSKYLDSVNFDTILTILYEKEVGEFTREEYVKILNALDYLCYQDKKIMNTIVLKISACISDFDQIVQISIEEIHKNILLEHFIDNIYDYNRRKYNLKDVMGFLRYSNIMNVSLKDKIFARIALKCDSIKTILNLEVDKEYKLKILENYLYIYQKENSIILKARLSDSTMLQFEPDYPFKRDDAPNARVLGEYVINCTEHKVIGDSFSCPDIKTYLFGLGIEIGSHAVQYKKQSREYLIQLDDVTYGGFTYKANKDLFVTTGNFIVSIQLNKFAFEKLAKLLT